MSEETRSILQWLQDIDESLVSYHEEFMKMHIYNTNCLKYVRISDLDKFDRPLGPIQKRMVKAGLLKLSSPKTQKLLQLCSTPENSQNDTETNRRGQLNPVNLFPNDRDSGTSPFEIEMGEVRKKNIGLPSNAKKNWRTSTRISLLQRI